ncbi:Lrp/AsnC family transcriptional regulator [Actinorugispora endophytica]|uniref:AsnC family transcriptional regulator n=1 Tax=Actinorugispora endophytica TaxID=1605990 RepID=A0A4R6V148_9ACTN|nr:AsnC family transcriptional regulator [Actinorugispora endophytica]TDQ53711.1 AsnC family transcriptional regulator [Actinorugispora endophytica]
MRIRRSNPSEQPDTASAARRGGTAAVLDDTAKRIIEQLRQDGRRSYAAIGKAVGLSEAAVRQRVQRLLETGVVQVVGITDPVMLGLGRQATVGVRCAGAPDAVADAISELEGVGDVVVTAGSLDLLVEVAAADDEQLLEILTRIRATPSVTGTESFLYLAPRRRTRTPGAR